ncbi:hypothetical protein CHS0354_019142 [Potamilus streckersoni]|uniref:39S ribosomal protein L37, mitochondrial n=1 Tax=Potamilus streckersoni TaxID=2493646 RepID=A0AAE0T0U4_9BIVA|nr:hypothetical protein CHS0354_019142 [Potamilus streckersoni]
MRLTLRLCKGTIHWRQKKQWEKKAQFRDVPVTLSKEVTKKIPDIEIHDPTVRPPFPKWQPPVDDIRFQAPPKLEDHRLYKQEEVYKMTSQTRFIEGLKQACILTKSQHFKGLPPGISSLVGKIEFPDQDLLVQRAIMHSKFWNPTKDKLQRRFDTANLRWHFPREYGIPRYKGGRILLNNLLHLCQSVSGQVPSTLMERHLIPNPHLYTHYFYKGKMVVMDSLQDYMTASKTELPPFGDKALIEDSVNYEVPDMFPLLPTIDFEKSHLYEVKNSYGWVNKSSTHCPQTIFKVESSYWPFEPRVSRDAMLCLGYAMVHAKHKYGNDVKILPEPVSIQCIDVNVDSICFIFFQLNTLDLDNLDGVKNFLWYDADTKLYSVTLSKPWLGKEHEKTVYHSYESGPFQKMLATYIYGCPETKHIHL